MWQTGAPENCATGGLSVSVCSMTRKSKKNAQVERILLLKAPGKLVACRSLFLQSLGWGVSSRGVNRPWGGASDQVLKEQTVI